MAVIYKDKYLKDIASLVRKGAMYFEQGDRPEIEMGGRKVFIGSVSYDADSGRIAYTVENAAGKLLPSAKGVRYLDSLEPRLLVPVDAVVRQYSGYRLDRRRNLMNINSVTSELLRRSGGVSI